MLVRVATLVLTKLQFSLFPNIETIHSESTFSSFVQDGWSNRFDAFATIITEPVVFFKPVGTKGAMLLTLPFNRWKKRNNGMVWIHKIIFTTLVCTLLILFGLFSVLSSFYHNFFVWQCTCLFYLNCGVWGIITSSRSSISVKLKFSRLKTCTFIKCYSRQMGMFPSPNHDQHGQHIREQ